MPLGLNSGSGGDSASASLHRKTSLDSAVTHRRVLWPPRLRTDAHRRSHVRPALASGQRAARPEAHSAPVKWPTAPWGALPPPRPFAVPFLASPLHSPRSPEPLAPSCAWPSEHPHPWRDVTFSTRSRARGGCRAWAGARRHRRRLTLQPLSVR